MGGEYLIICVTQLGPKLIDISSARREKVLSISEASSKPIAFSLAISLLKV